MNIDLVSKSEYAGGALDAVEMTHCGDCIFAHKQDFQTEYTHMCYHHPRHPFAVNKNWCCRSGVSDKRIAHV